MSPLRITQLLKSRAETDPSTWLQVQCSSFDTYCSWWVGGLGSETPGIGLLTDPFYCLSSILLDSSPLRNKVFIPVLLLPPSTCLQP